MAGGGVSLHPTQAMSAQGLVRQHCFRKGLSPVCHPLPTATLCNSEVTDTLEDARGPKKKNQPKNPH